MTDSSVAVLPSLGENEWTKLLETIGYQETAELSQSGFLQRLGLILKMDHGMVEMEQKL